MNCPICFNVMKPRHAPWSFHCEKCNYWGSTLAAVTKEVPKDEFLTQREDKENPIDYLDDMRLRNFRTILSILVEIPNSRSAPLLEVGCGAGLFLECATEAGFDAHGIEAYEAMARRAVKRGCQVRIGLFPDCVNQNEHCGVIIFNDVLEHLPNAKKILLTCNHLLQPQGLLVINIPNCRGLFFRVARVAARMGLLTPWERMWQKMFWSPHLHYFSPQSLELICRQAGFEPEIKSRRLKSVSLRGLWSRISADPHSSKLQRFTSLTGTLCLALIEPFFESDCTVRVFRKTSFAPIE